MQAVPEVSHAGRPAVILYQHTFNETETVKPSNDECIYMLSGNFRKRQADALCRIYGDI